MARIVRASRRRQPANRQHRAADAARFEVGDLLLLGGEPGKVGVADHVVEGEQAAEEDDVLLRVAAAAELLDA